MLVLSEEYEQIALKCQKHAFEASESNRDSWCSMTSCAKEVGKLIKDVGETTISSVQSHFLEKSNHLQVLQNYFSNAEKAFLADEEEEAQLWILAIQDAFQALKYTWLSINAMEENESKIASLLNQEATLYQGAEKNIAKAAEIYFRDDSYLILKNTRDRVVRAAELIEKAIEAIKSNEEKIANYYQQAAEYQVKDADALEEIREKWNLVSQYTSKIAEVMEKGLQVPPHLKQEAECYTQAANYYQQAAAYAFERTQQDVRNDKFRTAADYAAKAAETSIQKIRALQAKKEEAANYYQEAANFQIQAAEAISKENFWSLSLFHDTSESILNAAINSLEKKEEATFYYNKSKEYHLKALELWESNWWVAARHVYDAAELAKKGFDLEEKIANASKNGKMDIANLFLQARNYNQLAIQYKIRLAELEEKSKNFLFNDHFDIGIVWKNASDHASEACKFIENIGQLSFFIENQKEIESNKTQQYFPNHLIKEHLCFLEDKTTSEESRGVNLFFNSIINSYQSAFNYLVHSIKSFDQGNDKETVNNYQASERIFSQIELFKWIAMRPNAEEVTYKKMAIKYESHAAESYAKGKNLEAKAWEDASVLACEISECITMKKDESLYRSHDFNDDLTAVDQSFMNSKLKEVEFLLTQTLNYFQEALNYKKKSIQAYREMKIKEAQKLSECSAKTKQNGHLIRESIKLAILQKKLDQSYFCILVDVAINYQKALEYQKRKTTAAQSLIRIYDEILICAVKAIQIFISKNDEENHLQATLANSKCSYAIHFIQLNEQKAIAIAKRKRVSEWNPIVDLYERAIEYNNKAILAIKKNQRGHEYWNNASKYVTNAISAMEKAIEASIINRIQEKNLWMEIARFYQKMVQYAKQIAEKASNDNDDRQFETLRLIECIEKVAKSKEKSAAAFAIGNLEEKNRWSEIGGLYENAQKYQNKALKVLQKSNSEANYWRAASKHANSIALLTERIEELSFTENMEQANYLKQAVNFYQSAIHHSLKAVEEEQQNRRTKLWAYSAEKLVNAAELMEKAAKAIKKGATAILPVYTQSAIFYQTLANFMIETAKKRCEENFFQDPPHVWEIDEYERANWDPSDNIEFVVMEAESSLKGENVQKQQHRPPYWQNVIEYFTTAMDAGYNGNMEAMEKLLDAAMYENNAAIEFFGKSSENEYLVSEDEENLTDMAISGMSIEEERLKHIAVQSYHAAAVASAAMQENEAKNLADAGASAKKAKSCLFFSLYFEEGESNARSSRNYQRAANYYQEALGYFLKASSFFAQGEIKKASFWSDAANYADQAASTLEEMGLCYENKTKYRLKSVFKDHVQILQNHLEKKDIV